MLGFQPCGPQNTWVYQPTQDLGTKLCKKCRCLATSGSLAGLAGQQVHQHFQEQSKALLSQLMPLPSLRQHDLPGCLTAHTLCMTS